MSKKQRDGCVFCLGAKGGVPGNENVFGGHLACDFCTILLIDVRREAVQQIVQARARSPRPPGADRTPRKRENPVDEEA